MIDLPKKAVDEAARALAEHNRDYGDMPDEAVYRLLAAAALTAALPHLDERKS